MKPHSKYLQFFLSIIIVVFFYVVFRLLVKPENDPVNYGASVYFLVLIISIGAIATAVTMLVLRYAGKSDFTNSLLYNLTGVTNFCLGAGFIFLLFRDEMDETSLIRFAVNLTLGMLIVADIILNSKPVGKP